MKTMTKVWGHELKVGDIIAPWGGRTAVIAGFTPYTGPLKHLWPDGARIAEFAPACREHQFGTVGMTIDPWGTYDRVQTAAPLDSPESTTPNPSTR